MFWAPASVYASCGPGAWGVAILVTIISVAEPPPYDWDALLAACQGRTLADHLLACPLPRHDLIDAAPAPRPGEPYGRLPLHRSDHGEVLLVRWREDTFCAPHDHGQARGQVCLLRGQFVERLWRWREGDLVPAAERAYASPAIIDVKSGIIHDMKASGSGVGIHFYQPAIQGMQVFDRERRETLTVSDECGAWVPADPSLVLGRKAW
jgi:hypothetical protein